MTEKGISNDQENEPIKLNDLLCIEKERRGRKTGLVLSLTTKKRKVEIIFPTDELKAETFERAKKMGLPCSKFILACVQEKMDEIGPSSKGQRTIQNRIAMLEAEKISLAQEKIQLLAHVERLTKEVALWRTREGTIPVIGIEDHAHKLNKNLIVLLREKREVSGIEVVETLKLDLTDRNASDALWKDLQALKSAGLLESTVEGWKWLGK